MSTKISKYPHTYRKSALYITLTLIFDALCVKLIKTKKLAGQSIMEKQKITDIINTAVSDGTLKKIVLSKPLDKSILKRAVIIAKVGGALKFKIETFTKDNKAFHESVELAKGAEIIAGSALSEFMQTNIITTSGECEIKRSKSGSIHIGNRIKPGGERFAAESHNKLKRRILDKYLNEPFLKNLGICDKNGRIHDKMQAKYRQINRFLETVGDIADRLPRDRRVVVYDLCCGKSYLSFALYFYLERVLGLEIEMLGADLKRDVIDYCNSVASAAGMKNLRFVCGDISTLGLKDNPDMVVSLHACDIATDIVLAHAIKSGAGIILSTPCCHHELFASAKELGLGKELDFVLSHSMTSQKLCETLTDSLRIKTLEAYGYKTDAIELVTPDDTPKNLLIRATLKKPCDGKSDNSLKAAREAVGVELMLEKLLK